MNNINDLGYVYPISFLLPPSNLILAGTGLQDTRRPILYALGERDWLWEGTKEAVEEFMAAFPKCPRPDGSLVQDAPHALEWSRMSQGWYARCFGWAMEVCASRGIRTLLA